MGCEYAQGYLFARPSSPGDVDRMIAEGRRVGRAGAPVIGRRVLVVDDAKDVRQLARVSLTTAGFEVHQAATAAEALELATEVRPDCIVLDVQLPDASGHDICRALKTDPATAQATVVMLTTQGGADAKVMAYAAGADDYIVKPFSPRDLASRVGDAIHRNASVDA